MNNWLENNGIDSIAQPNFEYSMNDFDLWLLIYIS